MPRHLSSQQQGPDPLPACNDIVLPLPSPQLLALKDCPLKIELFQLVVVFDSAIDVYPPIYATSTISPFVQRSPFLLPDLSSDSFFFPPSLESRRFKNNVFIISPLRDVLLLFLRKKNSLVIYRHCTSIRSYINIWRRVICAGRFPH